MPTTLCLVLAGCAQTGPPLPPSLELPKPPSDLRAIRKGNQVTLTWSEPTLTTDRQGVRYLGPTLVCRSVETDKEMTVCGNPVEIMPAPTGALQTSPSPTPAPQNFTDTLPPAAQQEDPAAELIYGVEVLNRNARGAGLSNRIHISAVATLPPPSDLAAELNRDGVALTWTSLGESQNLAANPAAGAPAVLHHYRIYRRDESSGKDTIAGDVPLGDPGPTHFTDTGFAWERTYLYRITPVSIVRRSDSEIQVEGEDTTPVRVIAHDLFPPAVPAGLQAAYSGEGQEPFIDLIWSPATNADLAGYNVYRREADGAMSRLNSEPVKSPSYRDLAVASGKTYTYSVSAVDLRGNESQRSEATSESVP